MNPPEIELIDHNQKIQYFSELSEIFDREDLNKALLNYKYREKIFEPGM